MVDLGPSLWTLSALLEAFRALVQIHWGSKHFAGPKHIPIFVRGIDALIDAMVDLGNRSLWTHSAIGHVAQLVSYNAKSCSGSRHAVS